LRTFERPHHHDGVDLALMDGGDRLFGVFKQRQLGIGGGHGNACSARPDIKADQHSFGIGQVADDALERLRQLPDQGRNGNDLMPHGERRILHQVDDFNLKRPGRCSSQIFFRLAMAAIDFGV
jgi:hypothetical protein